jgi:glycogen debranching enzyme
MPLVLPDLPLRITSRLVAHLTDEREFWLPCPLPSIAASDPAFDPHFATSAIFRGPSWVNLNWYLYWGLRAHGHHDLARELALRTLAMVVRGGLRECYDPFDATGYGAHDFGWSALVLNLAQAESLSHLGTT